MTSSIGSASAISTTRAPSLSLPTKINATEKKPWLICRARIWEVFESTLSGVAALAATIPPAVAVLLVAAVMRSSAIPVASADTMPESAINTTREEEDHPSAGHVLVKIAEIIAAMTDAPPVTTAVALAVLPLQDTGRVYAIEVIPLIAGTTTNTKIAGPLLIAVTAAAPRKISATSTKTPLPLPRTVLPGPFPQIRKIHIASSSTTPRVPIMSILLSRRKRRTISRAKSLPRPESLTSPLSHKHLHMSPSSQKSLRTCQASQMSQKSQ